MLKRLNSPIPLIKHFAGIILCVKLPHGQSPSDPGRGFSENKKRRRARSEIPAALRLLLYVYATSFAAEASFAVLCTTIYFMSFAQDSTGTFKSYLLWLKRFSRIGTIIFPPLVNHEIFHNFPRIVFCNLLCTVFVCMNTVKQISLNWCSTRLFRMVIINRCLAFVDVSDSASASIDCFCSKPNND